MRKERNIGVYLFVFFLALALATPVALAAEEYKITYKELEAYKKFLDDPRPLWKDFDIKTVIPPEDYAKMTYDVEAMKKVWAEVIGFRTPDVVGKIAPEIKPGTYTYKDKEKYPGLKELMIPALYENWFKPGEKPLAGNFPEVKVIPTRQYYLALPIAKATKKNIGTTKLNDQGYILPRSYAGGIPFPRPEGEFKAQQIIYNWEKRYFGGDNYYGFGTFQGFNKHFKPDVLMVAERYVLRLQGRALMEPYGWYDERAEKRGELDSVVLKFLSPRDMYGSAQAVIHYIEPTHYDAALMYLSGMRRIRKMSTTDTQDAVAGQDAIYDDNQGFAQKLSPKIYPYKYELIGEREYLVPFATTEAPGYLSSQGLELRNYEFERRPTYVVKLTQLDSNYVYGQRILYIDKETFLLYYIENYDQKGRLYRSALTIAPLFRPDMGLFFENDVLFRDHLDLHSTFGRALVFPVTWLNRSHVDLGSMISKGK